MIEYHAKYKCRLCGEIFKTVTTGRENALRETVRLCLGYAGDMVQSPNLLYSHFCGDDYETGNIGIADFLGWEEVNIDKKGNTTDEN